MSVASGDEPVFSKAEIRIASLNDLDALVGEYVTSERPEIHWEDSHALFRFDTEEEARAAIRNPYYQLFLPKVDWSMTQVIKVRNYQPYSTELGSAWLIVERLSGPNQPLELRREAGRWVACFGNTLPAAARTAPVAICLAGLRRQGVELEMDPALLR